MISPKDVRITDEFWQTEQELVRTEVIPYQWEALNDRVPGAAPSFAIHNFRAARSLRERAVARVGQRAQTAAPAQVAALAGRRAPAASAV